jgi:hypothetical protein
MLDVVVWCCWVLLTLFLLQHRHCQGLYNDQEGQDNANDCKNCPNGRYNNVLGVVSATTCKGCPTGTCSLVVLLCCCVVVVNYSNTSNIVDTDRLLCTLFWLYFLFQVATTMAWANKPCPAASSAPEAPSTTPRFVLHCRTAKIAPMASTGTMWVW